MNGGIDNTNIAAGAGIVGSKLGITYTDYTPTWTASGTAPAIGNATTTARYAQLGKLVHCYGIITFGSTSTFGTGTYAFALPVTASSANPVAGFAILYDQSTGNSGISSVVLTTTATMNLQYPATWLGALTTAGQLAPWTWAQSDEILWNITYEAA